ncbi:hypothetical protein [Bacillus weihaiensis]|uniref:hypothetical protein n=1 Tax=Bacillus weihaiensis TaxID=1547283 RepID=UPI00235325DE|nr:hypothetical protein [Bacillus weihaiensis]
MIYIWEDPSLTEETLMNFTYITLAAALLLLVVTLISFYILLVNENYRKGYTIEEIRARFETKSYLPIVIGKYYLYLYPSISFSEWSNSINGITIFNPFTSINLLYNDSCSTRAVGYLIIL